MKRIFLVVLLLVMGAKADDLRVAAGGGFKQVVLNISSEYTKAYDKKVDGFFGHMPQIVAQSKSGDIPLLIGDKNHLLAQKVDFTEYKTLGYGYAVVIYAKGININDAKDLQSDKIKKIALPQPEKAVYGTAGLEFLKNEKLYDDVKDKLLLVSGVPQALTYVVANEVDAAIVNLSVALENIDKIGGYVKIDDKSYTPVEIIIGKLNNCDEKCDKYYDFMDSNAAQEVLVKYGLR